MPEAEVKTNPSFAPVREEAKVNKSNQQKKLTVNVDMEPEDVVKSSQAGDLLFFDDSPEGFLELETEFVDGLSRTDKQKYLLAYGSWRYNCDKQDPEPTEDIKVSPRFASAKRRLEIHGGDPKMHYVWKRSDEMHDAGYEGYTIARGSNLRTFGGGPKSKIHRLGVFGDDELILMMEPEERNKERIRAAGEKSSRRIETFDNAAAEELDRGGKAFRDGETKGGRFSPTK